MKLKTNEELRDLCKNNHYADWLNLPRLLDEIESLKKENLELKETIQKNQINESKPDST